MKTSFVYIVSNYKRTVLYIGVTADLEKRMLRHKVGEGSKFAAKYKCKDLLYYEECSDVRLAIDREKQLKTWHREWKLNLIKELNTELNDLSEGWFDEETLENAKLGFSNGD